MKSMYPSLHLYIDGIFIDSNERECQEILNPATFEVLGCLPFAIKEDLDLALDAANKAFKTWRNSSPVDRSSVLRKVAELARQRANDIAQSITLDNGKPLSEAIAEVMSSAEHADWSAEECRRIYGRVVPPRNSAVRQLVVREPVGVCAAFTPWNFPLSQAMKKIVAAIGAGCTVVLKGPEESPSAIVHMAKLFHDAGLPPGVLNIVWGVPADISKYLIESPIVRKVAFTGSVPVGKQLASLAALHMKRISMELGGHSPVLVLNDADIDHAANFLAYSKIRNAGQVCVSPSRFFIQEKVHDKFVDKFSKIIKSIKVGNGLKPDTQMGPLIHSRRLGAVDALVQDATSRGAELVYGGKRIGGKGNFYEPTVLVGVSDEANVMRDEPFGPVASITKFTDVEDAVSRANSVPYGLASYVFTNSVQNSIFISNSLEVGMVNINHSGMALPELPFGGIKDSGMGSEGGAEIFDSYLVTKMITQI